MSYYNRTSGTFMSRDGTDGQGNPLPRYGGQGSPNQNLYWQSMSQRFAHMSRMMGRPEGGYVDSPHYGLQNVARDVDDTYGDYSRNFFGSFGTGPQGSMAEAYGNEVPDYSGDPAFTLPEQRYQGHKPNSADFNAAVDAYRAGLYDLDSNYGVGRSTVPTGGMSNADYAAEFSGTRDWHNSNYDGVAQSTNMIRDMIVDNFGMMDELIKVGYSIEEAGEILNKSALSTNVGGSSTGNNATFSAQNRTKWEDTMKSRYEEAAVFGGILDDFQVAYDKKAVEYHDNKLIELNIIQLLAPEKYDEAWNSLSLKDKNVQAFKMYEKGMLEPPGRRQELENQTSRGGARKYTDAQIDAIVGDEATKQYKQFVMSNMEQSGEYDHVYILPAGSPQGGSKTTEDMYAVKMKGSAFNKDASYEIDDNFFFGDDPVSTAGQYGYQRVKFFPEETLKAGGVYGPSGTYRNLNVTNTYAEYFIDDEVSEEDRALRKDVGKLETIGGLGEYLDVSIDKAFAMPAFARVASSFISPWVALTVTAMDVVFNDKTLTLADYMSAGLSALKAFDIITPPASAKEVKAAGEAAEVAADATWKVGDAFTSVGRSAMDAHRAANVGVGLAGMSYSQTVGLINAVATGDPMSFVFSEFGSDLMDGALEEFGVDLDTLDPGIKQGLYKGMNKLAQGEDWEEAFASGVATWLRDTELGGDFIDSLREIGRDLDDQYLQPILDAIPDEINSGDLNLPSWDEITEWAAGSVGGLTDGFKVILSEMNNIIPGISDESRTVIGEFVEAIPTTNIESAISKLGQMTGGVFDNLDEGIKDALEQGLQDAVINGEVDEAAMARAVSAGAITVNAIGEQFPEYLQDVAGARLITQSIQNAVTSAMLGGDASDAFLQTIATAATKAIQKSIDEGTLFDDLAQYQDKVTGEYTKTRLATDRMNTAQSTYNQAVTGAKALEAEMQGREEALEVLRVRAETTGRESDQDAYDDAFQSYSMYIANEAGPRYNNFVTTMNDAEQDFTDAKTDFDAASVDLNDATVVLNDNVAPVYQDVMKGAVAEIDPNFDEAWYRQKYDIPDGVSAYDHYINSGVQFGTPTNADAYTAQYDAAFNKLMNTAITASGINPAKLSPEELQRIRNQLTNRYGDDIQSLKDGIANESALKWRVQSSLMALSDLGNAQDFVLTEQNIDSMKERLEAAGFSEDYIDELAVGSKIPVADRRNLAVSESNQKSSMGIELGGAADWADVVSGDAQLTFDPVSGKLTWEVLSTEGMQSVSYDDEYGLVLQGTDRFGNDVLTVQENNNQYAIVDGEMKPLNGTFAGPDGQDVQYVNGDIKLRKNQTITEQTDDGGFRFYEANANGTTYVQEQDAEGNLTEAVPAMQTEEFQAVFGSSDPLETLLFTDPEAWLKTIGEMPQDVGEDVAGNWWYKTAKGMLETLDKYKEEGFTLSYSGSVSGIISGNPEVGEKTAEQFVDDYVNVIEATNEFMGGIDWFIETVKNVPIGMSPAPHYAAAGLEYNENIHKAMIEDFQSGQEEIPGSTFQQVTNAISGMANATHTEEYRQERDKMYALLESDGVWEAISTYPGMFVKDLVIKEVIQEVPTLLFGGGFKIAGQLVGRGLKQSDDIVASMSNTFGFTGAVAIDMAEAYGGEASGAYDEFYTLATTPKFNAVTGEMEAPMTVEEAERFASENAHAVGISSMMITGLTMGIGGADMYKKVFGKDMSTATLKEKNTFLQMYETLKPMSSEFVTGGIEEGSVAAVKELLIYNSGLDPDRDWSQNILTSATLGAILEGTVAGTVGGLNIIDPSAPGSSDPGSVEGRILMNGNPTFQLELADTIGNGGSAADVEAVLDNFGLEDSVIRTDILDLSFDSEYNSSQEVSVMFEDLGFVASEADIANFVGAVDADTTLSSDIATFIDPLFTDRGEVQEAALAEGIILTDEEADLYVQQDTEENVATVLKLDIQDPDTDVGTPAVTVEQIKNEFLSNGRIITDAQAEQFLGDTLESAQTDISEFLEEKPGYGTATVGTGFIRAKGIDDHGVYLTNAQMQQFLNKYGTEDISAAIGEWVASEPEDIRPTMTRQQVKEYAESLGYMLTDEEADEFIRKPLNWGTTAIENRINDDPEFGFKVPEDGKDGQDGTNGVDGIDGVDGASAYELAKAGGYTGTESEWLASLEGVDGTDGNSAYDIAVADGYDGTEAEWVTSLQGTDGARGARGLSAYDIAVEDGFVGTETEWLASLESNVTDLGTTLNARIDELEAESGDRDAAIAQAVSELAQQQDTDVEALTKLLEEQKSQTAAVAEILGKPEREVTQEDIDNVADLIASQDVLQNPEGYVPTSEDMLYDVNNDGVIDAIDQVLLEDSFGGQDVEFAADSQFGDATGLYLQIAQQNEALAEQEAQRQADLAAQQQQQQEQQQAYSDANYLAEVQAQREQLDQLGEQAIGAVQQQVSVGAQKPSPLTQIDYLFDVYGDEIFATPQQKELFASPYGRRQPTQRAAQGGIIQTNDELLRLLGE